MNSVPFARNLMNYEMMQTIFKIIFVCYFIFRRLASPIGRQFSAS